MLIHYNCMEKYGKYINQNIFLCVSQKKVSPTGLNQQKGE